MATAALTMFLADRFASWCTDRGIALRYIQPGRPNQNAFVERFNRTFRQEVFDAYVFESLELQSGKAWIRKELGHCFLNGLGDQSGDMNTPNRRVWQRSSRLKKTGHQKGPIMKPVQAASPNRKRFLHLKWWRGIAHDMPKMPPHSLPPSKSDASLSGLTSRDVTISL